MAIYCIVREVTYFSSNISFGLSKSYYDWHVFCREIYRYKESSHEKTVIDCLLLLENAEIPEGLDTHSGNVVRIGPMVMKKLSGVQSAESIEAIALMRFPTSFLNLTVDQNKSDSQSWFPSTHRILVLDGIQVFCKLLTSIFFFPAELSNYLNISLKQRASVLQGFWMFKKL